MPVRFQGAPVSDDTIEPSAIFPPRNRGGEVVPVKTGRQKFYDTYNTHDIPLGGDENLPPPSGGGGFNYQGGRVHRAFQSLPNGSGAAPVTLPKPLPRFLAARPYLFFLWVAAMGMVAFDEWHSFHILPRPARLWYTSITFFILALISISDRLVPIVNIYATGLVIVLGYQYYQGTGQFGAAEKTGTSKDQQQVIAAANAEQNRIAQQQGKGGITVP
jgi:hypothetical protein